MSANACIGIPCGLSAFVTAFTSPLDTRGLCDVPVPGLGEAVAGLGDVPVPGLGEDVAGLGDTGVA